MTTDVPCGDLREASITVGSLDALEARPPLATGTACDPTTGTIGTLVLVPSGAKDAEFAVRVVVGIGDSADGCAASHYVGGCIVARRVMRFVPGTPLELPIAMRLDCKDVPCGLTETCVNGSCVSARVPDPAACKDGDACGESHLLPDDGGAGDGNTDGPAGDADATMPDDGPAADGDMDVRADAVPIDATASDAHDAATDAPADAADAADAAKDGGADADADSSPPPITYCTNTMQCGANRYCSGVDTGMMKTFCVAAVGAKPVGAACQKDGDCASNRCAAGTGVCSEFCDADAQCVAGMSCVHAPEATLRPFAYECHPACTRDQDCAAAGGVCVALYESNATVYHAVCGLPWGQATFGMNVSDYNQCQTAYSDLGGLGMNLCTRYCTSNADCASPLPNCKVPLGTSDHICRL
jgi:hypothetical protein